MRVLVTGGAGYVGSHVVRALCEAGHETLVYDNLSCGHRAAVAGRFCSGDLCDRSALAAVLSSFRPDASVHLAALAVVSESMDNPMLYYRNNVVGSLTLLEQLVRARVHRLVFSSSAAVYGKPSRVPLGEDHSLNPVSPYGETKAVVERLLSWMALSHGFHSVSLRYFNASGAQPGGEIGEDHDPETHLIPLVLRSAVGGGNGLTVFGDDFDTRDGTCIRDFIHVSDLAEAHVRSLESLATAAGNPRHRVYNLGTERGYSVMEVIRAAEKVTGRVVPYRVGPRRPGDPPILVASSARARKELGWTPTRSDLDTIMSTAWTWHQSHPHGYGGGNAERR